MSKIRKLKLRTISLVLTFAMIMGCVCNTAAAEAGSEYVDYYNDNLVQRVYDSGNVTLSNQVKADKKSNIFTIKLNVKVVNINNLPCSTASDFSATDGVKDSSATGSRAISDHALLSLNTAAIPQEETPYEVRYYIESNLEVVESSIPDNAVLENDGQYVSWPDLTTKDISGFSTNIELQPKTNEDVFDDSNTNPGNRSGVYQDGEPIYLFAQMNLPSAEQLPPITAKTAKLKNWDKRTYDINLSVTAQSQIQTSTTPCDIILVLDRSGSMADSMYTPVNNPNKNDTYYIHRDNSSSSDNSYVEVSYHPGRGWWYYDDWSGWHQVYPTTGGTGRGGNYQFYTRSSQTKLQALKTAAKKFVDNVKTNSSDSRIGVLEFSERVFYGWGRYEDRANIISNLNGKSLLKVGNANSLTKINHVIDGLPANGATAADYGLQKAAELFDNTDAYEAVDTETNRKKIVVFFTDGEPNHGSGFDEDVANDAIEAADTLKAESYNATVYSIGVFSGLSGAALTKAENYMEQVASSADKYYPAGNASALNDIFETISNEVGGISGAAVTDVIDPRFELTTESMDALRAAGATVTNTGDTQTIKWKNQTIDVKTDAQGKLIPGWTKEFTVKAKAQFIGGNAIPTNVEKSSGVIYGDGLLEKFPQPTVNVRPVFYIGNAEATIFYGESVPTTTLNKYAVQGKQDVFCGKPATGDFSYQWFKSDGTTQVTSEEEFPTGELPNDDTDYTLKATFTPGEASDDSTANSDGNVAEQIQNTVNQENNDQGKYIINVIKGELNITENIDKKYPAPTSVSASQSFVFKIERHDTEGRLQDTFYEVITLPTSGSVTKRVTGLKKGRYTVTEETSDAWRYTQTAVSDNDDTISVAGTVFIGRDTTAPNATQKSYFGAGENKHDVTANPAIVEFTNSLTKHQWLGDTTVAVNTIRQIS